jgi:Protein of unknown function (DUF3551)
VRMLFLAVGVAAGMTVLAGGARAQNYPWCAYYGGGEWGTNCGFSTYEQCRATVSGMSGSCQRNTQYVPPPGPHAAPYQQPGNSGR